MKARRAGATAKVESFPGHHRGQTRHTRGFAGIGHRVHHFGGRGGEHQVDLVVVDQRLGQLAGTRRIGLCVAVQDFNLVLFATDRETTGQRFARQFQHVAVAFTKAAQRTGPRTDKPDF